MDLLNLSAADLSIRCLGSFDLCLNYCPPGLIGERNSQDTSEISMQSASSIERPILYRLADFNLWIDGTGALASNRASLDWRLKERPIDLTLVKGNLVMLYQFTQDYADLQAKHCLLDEALRDIDSSLANLSSLGLAIRRTGRKARLFKADSRFNEGEHADLKMHLQCIIALRPSQERRGDNEFQDSLDTLTLIQRRLVQANLRRRNRFLQAQRHSAGLRKRASNTKLVPTSPGDNSYPEPTRQQPLECETNNASSFSTPNESRKAVDTRKSAPTLSGTSASMPSSNLRYIDPSHQKSEGSTHTEITRIAASTHYPRPRMPSTDQSLFQCPCCCQMLPVEEFKNDDKWRKHLSEDICPYTCFLESCPEPFSLYSTRAELERHIRHDHQPIWQCPICDDQPTFTTKTETQNHASHYHQAVLKGYNITGEGLESLVPILTQYMMGVETCPLCQETGSIDSPELVDHVMEHIHEFSLRSLPWPRPSDIDIGGEVGSHNTTCEASSIVKSWLEDLEAGHDPCSGNCPSYQISQFDRNRLPLLRIQTTARETEETPVEIFFANEHGDESAVAETDISPLSRGTIPSFDESALPEPDSPTPSLIVELKRTGPRIGEDGAPLSSPSEGTNSAQPGILKRSYNWMLRTFYAREIDITIVGLQGCGKTSLLRVLSGGEFTIDSIPTVGFNMKKIERNGVTIKCWDLGGQPRFRSMWERYCRGVACIVFVVDASDAELIPLAKEELHDLMSREATQRTPLLVLGNNSEHPDRLTVDELIDRLDLKSIKDRQVNCYGISAKEEANLDAVVEFIAQFSNRPIDDTRRQE